MLMVESGMVPMFPFSPKCGLFFFYSGTITFVSSFVCLVFFGYDSALRGRRLQAIPVEAVSVGSWVKVAERSARFRL